MSPPFRADHVGSLLRPPELLRARAEHAPDLRAREDEAIAAVVRMQEEVGLHSATDGEFRRGSWVHDFGAALEGVRIITPEDAPIQRDERGRIEAPGGGTFFRLTGRIGLAETIFADDFAFLRSQTTTATPKLTIPSPSMLHYRAGGEAIEEVYDGLEAFWDDVVAAYREELRRLAELGCTYLQLDDTSLAYVNDPRQREFIARIGGDAEHQHLTYIAQLNRVLADKPAGMTVTVHLCRGNLRSSWMAEGGYDFVAEPLFGELDVDGFFLEYDDARSGSFEPLRFVPPGKRVVLGLVTTKRGELESKDDLKRRIGEASRIVPLDQLCLSPQCGFASVVEGNALTYDEQVAKLRLVVETAAEVWS
jgi:5-methyltetrahydropteroyltriglutamate--homocysteine methyltransferase